MRRDDLLRRHAGRNPRLDCRHLVERVGTCAALAMIHARHHEQRDAVGRCVGTDRLHDFLVVDRARLRRHLLIGPAVVHQQLAAVREERLQVRIAGEQRAAVGRRRLLDAFRDLERAPVPPRILEQNVREPRDRQTDASSDRIRARQSITLPGDPPGSAPAVTLSGLVATICTRRSTSLNGGGRKNRLSTMLKIAVLAPMPSARVAAVIAV